jgi:hypothetical protein
MNHDMGQAEERTDRENAYSESGTSPPQPSTELIARLYHAHHLVPVPLDPFEKKPMIKAWADATARPSFDDLLPLWRTGRAGIGLVTGQASGIVVVDVDPRNGGDPTPFLGTTDAVARTANDGWHFFYRYDGEIADHRGILRGVDLKADGGQVVVWPSQVRRKDGELGPYRWGADGTFDKRALAALLAGRLRGFSTVAGLLAPRPKERKSGRAERLPDRIVEGRRNDCLHSLAGTIRRRGAGRDTILAALLQENQAKCVPPLDETEIKKIAESAMRYEPAIETHTGSWAFASDVKPEKIDWVWAGRLARGKVTVLDGDPAQAKTSVTLDLAARVSTGAPMPDEQRRHTPAGAVIVNYEDGRADTIIPRLMAAGADLSRIAVFDLNAAPTISDDEGLREIEEAITATNATLLVVDPLMAGVSDNADSHNDHKMRRALRPLAAMAERTHVAVLATRHRPKGGSRNAVTSGNGSIAIIGAARCGLLAAYDPDVPESDPDRQHCHVLAVSKANLTVTEGTLRYRTIGVTIPGAPDDPFPTLRVDWRGHSALSGDAIVAREAVRTDRRDVVEDVTQQLRQVLESGPVPAEEIYERLGRRKDDWALRQAKARLGGRTEKERGKGKGRRTRWIWSLPAPVCEGEVLPASSTGQAL